MQKPEFRAPDQPANKAAILAKLDEAAVIRAILLNHLYHHRGQLSVYLRMLDVPVPATYGQSADESLFD
jgi:uncharacterized damage-inducible protein DinB